FIYIYDSTGTEYGKYSGTELAGVQIDLEGGSFKIKLTSDVGVNRYGFRLASVYATAPTAEYQKEIPALGHNWSNKDGICAKEDCGYECPHENFTDGICDACGHECTHESYTDSKCDACGYICTHEGQNGSCEVCGANLGKLVIDVTDGQDVNIGTGYEYYDEDGYIITGANTDTYVYIYESADLTLKNAVFSRLFIQYAPEDSVINITLEGANEVVGFIGFMKEHLIFNGSEGATLKTPYIYTNGGNGTATVNGGNIILTDEDAVSVGCGDFIINGGTVTASQDSSHTILRTVHLNGGTLNVVNTSPECEAINGTITMNKGALLTVNEEYGIMGPDAEILKADGLGENDYFFVRYDTESEFVPVQDIEAALDGKTYAEIKIDTHEHDLDNNGKCVCGYECTHKSYTDSKCDACGYICTHEGQNGSCQVCGANLGKLVIDVTDEQYVHIGSGQEYYDEDGYIITGNNPAVEITVFEGGNYTLDGVTAKTIVDRAGDDTVNITIKGNNVFTGSYNFSKADFIIDAVDGATLKALYVTTGGKDGTLTVNGGDIVFDYVTESYSHTIACNGGFIINGGTVTASNNFSHVVYNAVTLNGGELNVISTSADYAAIEETVTMKKGALLTVSAASGMLGYDSDAGYIGKIVMADDAEENDYFFVRYDTESEFVPVQDINSALDGKTYAEIKIDTHEHSYTDGICDCGYVCLHVNFADGICPDCTASGKLVAIKMTDSNNDGWYGKNAVVIKQLVDGAFEEVETATLTDGKSGTVAVNLDKD
ncbi:MAG: hypothetical protein IKK37_00005, partial [Clostridia bacterium]|nr:hypothetical protein [Clostridia bacterium]